LSRMDAPLAVDPEEGDADPFVGADLRLGDGGQARGGAYRADRRGLQKGVFEKLATRQSRHEGISFGIQPPAPRRALLTYEFYTLSGTTKGLRYSRVSSLAASGSPTTTSALGSNLI